MKLRLSFTILNLWSRGLVDEAVDNFFKIEKEPTVQMLQGLAVDKLITEKILEEKKLPSFFNNLKLINPIPQLKIEFDFKKFNLVGVLDCYDEGTIYEFKTGKIPSNVYAQGNQIAFYSFITSQFKPVEKIIVLRYDQMANKSDATLIWQSRSLIDKAVNFIEKNGEEIYQYLDKNGLLEVALNYKNGKKYN